eukprot:1162101-Pelagomonas_calceolata.AAC.20
MLKESDDEDVDPHHLVIWCANTRAMQAGMDCVNMLPWKEVHLSPATAYGAMQFYLTPGDLKQAA